MTLPADFNDFISLLNKHKVEYLVVGGYAVMTYGEPRLTDDLDIWIMMSSENAEKIIKVLKDFGFLLKGVSQKDFEKDNAILQLGRAPIRIDVMTTISGVTYDEAVINREMKRLGENETWFIGLKELIKNKVASGRKKDIIDAEKLKKIELKKHNKK